MLAMPAMAYPLIRMSINPLWIWWNCHDAGALLIALFALR